MSAIDGMGAPMVRLKRLGTHAEIQSNSLSMTELLEVARFFVQLPPDPPALRPSSVSPRKARSSDRTLVEAGTKGRERVARPVFISYARQESAAEARNLHNALGTNISFLDQHDLDAGDELPSEIVEALLGAQVVVVFVTDRYFTRWYCLREYELATSRFRDIVAAHGDESQRKEALAGLVVALKPGVTPTVLDQLPPALRATVWPSSEDTCELAALVHRRLAGQSLSAQAHSEAIAQAVPRGPDEALLEQALMPTARSLAGAPLWGPPGEPPLSLLDGFVGRADELWLIHHVLSQRGETNAAALTGSLEGGGGFGRTRLAAEYLHRYGPTFYPGGLFWVRADLELEPQMHGILSVLEPATPDLRTLKEAGRDACTELGRALDRQSARAAVLFVVDNVPEPLRGETPLPLSTWCPAIGKVSLLVTSRATQSLMGPAETIGVDVLAPRPAVALLTHGYDKRRQLSEADWERVAAWVGNLPLALEILNAWLRGAALDPRELLRLVVAPPVAELDRAAEALRDAVPRGALRGITETLMRSYESLAPPMQDVARLIARVGAAPVPLALLEAFVGDNDATRCRVMLQSRSLLMEAGDGTAGVVLVGRMHSVLAAFLRSRAQDSAGELRRAGEVMAGVMEPQRCRDPAFWPLMNACLPHAEELLRAAATEDAAGPASVIVNMGLSMGNLLRAQGLAARAIEPERMALAAAISSGDMGADHPDTLQATNNLGLTLYAMGDFSEARDLQKRALERRRRVLGNEHLETLESMNGLGLTLHALGEFSVARDLQQEALNVSRHVLGSEHPNTLEAANNLSLSLRDLGELSAARDLQEEVVDACRRILGPEHPDTILAMGNLAWTLQLLGDLPPARSLFEQVLDDFERILGSEHPETLKAKNNLAGVLTELGELAIAQELQEQVLAVCARLLGDEHPDTIYVMGSLAVTLNNLGDLPAARRLWEQVVRGYRRLFGEEHHETFIVMGNLAWTLHALGDLTGARKLQEQVIEGCRRLGDRHPSVAPAAWNLFRTLMGLHEEEAAQTVFHRDLRWLLDSDPGTLRGVQQQIGVKLQEWIAEHGG